MFTEYDLLPTSKRKGSVPPIGWVTFTGSARPVKRRTMTEGYISQRLPRNNTIAMNQNYVTKVLDNPRTPNHNRQVVIDYVLNHPEKFTALADNTDDPELNEWAKKRNGGAMFGFMSEFRKKYLRRNSE